ncbi:hypothetical protein NLU13_9464 [Sarocladium strictum]|uniref:Mediator of RNA polymerase II transcription subunit 6 n=1 Tax=Sarocladium strictum TaxID=5046 RepID=A0AA39L477_SARSR|nr:hypothetical protein NLU13_9464 [Sarocladium strictum]
MASSQKIPLDEVQWKDPRIVASMGGLHSNTVLFYFAESPFYEKTSNNAVVLSQALNNQQMYPVIQTREAFEAHLKTMSGLEFLVGEEPAESGPGMGTGVWVIRKQTRKKRWQQEDEVTVHASYFVVGENIYMAPRLSDMLACHIMTISTNLSRAFSEASNLRQWRPSVGHVYKLPTPQNQISHRIRGLESKEATPMPETKPGQPAASRASEPQHDETALERVAEEAFMVHMRYGGEYIDKNPITGRPGEFHLSSTGRKAVPPPHSDPKNAAGGLGAMNGPPAINTKLDDKKDGKAEKTPKSATMPKPKRKKSKMGGTPAAS